MTPSCKFGAFVIFVKEMETSRRFYEQLLGQEVAMDHGLNVGYKSGLALWQQDYALNVIHGKPVKLKRGNDLEIYFESSTIDEMYEAVRSAGAPLVHEVREQPWGQRVFRFHDPDNVVIEIGEPIDALVLRLKQRGMTDEEIEKKTTLPLEIVRALLASSNP